MQIRVLALLALTIACSGGARGPVARFGTAHGTAEVALEIADTPPARNRGLMYRDTLPDGRGMLFVFEDDADHEFWMKNTFIPLDMIFISADRRIVGVHANATPQSTAAIGVGAPSRYVLEVPGGWAARHGIMPGNRVVLDGVASP
ncbi:MAG TPA: DUF192 domain-containing protein [Candidatus Binatia bacterium]|nr:DUF192 domain-containing protein [Candidatus Binatia bacterium]